MNTPILFKVLWAAFIIMFTGGLSQETFAASPETVVRHRTTVGRAVERVFSGLIDERYKVRMNLQIDDEQAIGSYVYLKFNQPIQLKGEVAGTDIRLDEFDSSGKATGGFEGRLYENRTFAGIWRKTDGSQPMSFKVDDVAMPHKAARVGSVIIEPEQKTLFRNYQEFPDKTGIITYPVVNGLKEPFFTECKTHWIQRGSLAIVISIRSDWWSHKGCLEPSMT